MSDENKINFFMGKMEEWKESLTHSFDKVIDKLDTFVTKTEFENHKQKIEELEKKITTLTWLYIISSLIMICGEAAIHHMDWIFSFFK
jgi:hypothetical protein